MTAAESAALHRIATEARRRAAAVIAIDGPSGAGKSTLADALAGVLDAARPGGAGAGAAGAASAAARVRVIRLDDAYPGWHGLERGAADLRHRVIAPISAGRVGWRSPWDWEAGRRRPAVPMLPLRATRIVEGCGAFAAAGDGPRTLRVWVAAPDALRRQRALARDGGRFDPYWDVWETQWRRYAARGFAARAHLVVRVAAGTAGPAGVAWTHDS